jgi:hypothetical protein
MARPFEFGCRGFLGQVTCQGNDETGVRRRPTQVLKVIRVEVSYDRLDQPREAVGWRNLSIGWNRRLKPMVLAKMDVRQVDKA